MKRLIMAMLAALACAAPPAAAQDCARSDQLVDSVKGMPASRARPILLRAVRMCPTNAKALTRLARLHLEMGQADRARQLYRAALEADPSLADPHAGLGDIAFTAGRFRAAAAHYRAYLRKQRAGQAQGGSIADRMARPAPAPGAPPRPKGWRDTYQAKYERARLKAAIHGESMNHVVARQRLLQGLYTSGSYHGIGGVRVRERLALGVRFEFDTARLTPMGRRQLDEMAAALQAPPLRHHSVLIEGHTDTIGEPIYNLKLSVRRARAVRDYLEARGVNPNRLRLVGLGESRPVVTGGGKMEQAPNRRVEFVDVTP